MATDYKKLQNGSDIRGVALEGVAGENVNLGIEEAKNLTLGFAKWLAQKTGKRTDELVVSIGHDSRISAAALKEAAIESLVNVGAKVFDCGLASTPAMFMSTVFDNYKCDGAIMITASHLPFNRNGFKYFDKDGGLNKGDITWIIDWASQWADGAAMTLEMIKPGEVEKSDLIGTYADYLRAKIIREVAHPQHPDQPLKGLKIVVDAGNGAGGFYASRILAPLGADVSGSQFLEPDGTFPNHAPNPENKEAMASISAKVLETGANFGIIFDTDVDRSSAVDKSGKEISRNAIVAMAAALIAKEHPGTTVVTDSITSDQLTVYLEECLGLKHLRFKRGYKNVINKSIELNAAGTDSQLAIETSGHAAYKENFFLDDGAYLATKIVIKAAQLALQGQGIDVILASLEEPKEAVEVRFPIEGENFGKVGAAVLEDLKAWAAKNVENGVSIVEPNYEGVRLNFRREGLSGWCLLRKSLHDPILPLNVEVTEGSCETILSEIKEFLGGYEQVVIK
ncbi:MAG: phosphomannomutase/phosphoglucomutase [Firmicutes bacterium]|nr:phosphomannomutase/phosphoglucomutase [Bacillota bacterium]